MPWNSMYFLISARVSWNGIVCHAQLSNFVIQLLITGNSCKFDDDIECFYFQNEKRQVKICQTIDNCTLILEFDGIDIDSLAMS